MKKGPCGSTLLPLLSTEIDPAINLALEEALFGTVSPERQYLLVYRNQSSVICGRFQVPWIEADVDWLAATEVPVVRRQSGGGTVWHDEGNWNFSFMTTQEGFSQDINLASLASWLEDKGFDAMATPRGDLKLGGKKISGNALVKKSDRVLHHCSLLVSADLTRLRLALRKPWADRWRIESRGVASVPSPVTSLAEHSPGLDHAGLWHRLAADLEKACGMGARPIGRHDAAVGLDWAAVEAAAERYRSWDWNYGASPDFTAACLFRPGTGLQISQGRHLDATGSEWTGLAGQPFVGFAALEKMACQDGECRV
jgi:lipoate-protein ligase A